VASEIGMPNSARLTHKVVRDAYSDVGKQFDQAYKDAGDLALGAPELKSFDDSLLRASADDQGIANAYINDIKADLGNVADGSKAGQLSSQKASQYRNRLEDDIKRASDGGRMDRVQTLNEIQQVLDDVMERQAVLKDPGVAESLADARYKWRILSSLSRSTATIDPGGNINLRSFMTAWQGHGNKFGKASARSVRGESFGRKLETLNYLTARVEPSSGTAQRLLAAGLSGGLPKMAGGAALLGGGYALGN